MAVIIYGSLISCASRAALIAADAIGVTVEFKTINMAKGEHTTPEYLKLNPNHTIPTLDDNGVIVPDSHAIITYLVSKYAKDDSLYPKDLAKRSLVDARLHYDSGVAFSILRVTFTAHLQGQKEYLTPWQTESIQNVYDIVNTFLEQSKWVAGDSITVADISLATTFSALNVILAVEESKYPNVCKWLEAANALPYFSVNKTGVEQYEPIWKAISSPKTS